MIGTGDGVRPITAVLFAGQMMTPGKVLAAESCPGAESDSLELMDENE
jgi:hypothetical protein